MDKELKDSMIKFSIRTIIISILVLVLGIVIIAKPDIILSVITKVLGVLIIVDGVWHCYKFTKQEKAEQVFSLNLVIGTIETILGLIFIIKSSEMFSWFYIFVGMIILIESILQLQLTLTKRNFIGNWKVALISSLISLIVGILVLTVYAKFSNVVIGAILIVSSICNLIEYCYLAIILRDNK